MPAVLSELEQRLGYRFTDPALLERALTHRSFGANHNERLEFLGDAMVNLAISRLLWGRFADLSEGDLTRIRAHLVCEDSLHRAALALALPTALRLSEGEARSGGAQRASILADAVEALIGAVYLDGGDAAAHALVARLFGPQIASANADSFGKDAKTALQEWLQARRLPTPSYRITATHGAAHAQTFDVLCEVPSQGWQAGGRGRSRRSAEQDAAAALLATLVQESSRSRVTP